MPDTDGPAPEKLRRERAGTYVSSDGRFTVEQSSSGWMLLDAEQSNELGLPLAHGPFSTLDEAREAIGGARTGKTPEGAGGKASIVSIADRPRKPSKSVTSTGSPAAADPESRDAGPEPDERPSSSKRPPKRPAKPEKPAVVIRELRAVDGDQLRKLWAEAGFRSLGDDDLSIARMARRNPGLLLVAAEGTRIVGSALGAWDGRRGWIYHVATAESHRRRGIAAKLVRQVEAGLRDLGCPKVSVLVRDENDDGREFWQAQGYERGSRQYARELRRD